jgi:hypothetical protein
MTSLLVTWLQAMKWRATPGERTRREARRTRPHRIVPRLEALEDRTVPSTFTVTNNLDTGVTGDGSLRGEIAAAASGDTINFDPSLAGQTISLIKGELAITQSLDIEGPGANQLTVSGNNASRVFDINAGTTVTIAGLTITNGLADGNSPGSTSAGGGILNAGNLMLASDVLSNNQAVGDAIKVALGNRPGGAVGGGLANLGTLTIAGSTFTGNQVLGFDGRSATSAGNASGGAILNSGSASIADSQFTFNVAQAGSDESGSMSATGSAGAISNTGSLIIAGSTFSHNQAIGGNNSSGTVRPGAAIGGAILSGGPTGPGATLVVNRSTFDHNQALGGNGNQSATNPAGVNGPNDAFGGAIHLSAGTANTITDSTIAHNVAIAGAGAAGQDGGLAWGGGIDLFNSFGHAVSATVSSCTVDHNAAIGGQGGPGGNGGDAWGGGLAALLGVTLTVTSSTVDHNRAVGGAGGSGGDGYGGSIYDDALSSLALRGAAVEHNLAIGGDAGPGGSGGEGVGGGVYIVPGGIACGDEATVIAHNHTSTSDDEVFGDLGTC